MKGDPTPTHLTVYVGGDDLPAEEVDALAHGLLRELRELDVESAELAAAGPAPAGAKAGEAITLGAVALAVLPAILPKVLDYIQAWVLRGRGRVVKFKGKLAGHEVEFEGTAAELRMVLAALAQSDAPAERDSAGKGS
jgi:hypothetical protein